MMRLPSAPSGASPTDLPIRTSPRFRRRAGLALAVAAALAACEGAPTGTAPDSGDANVSAEREFVAQVNGHRKAIGCPLLSTDSRVAEVAARHSRDMALRGYFGHTDPDGVDPWQRLAAAGVRYSTAGENIAYGQSTGEMAFRTWMNSAPHRKNIENCAFTHHGVGVYEGRWTHVFIRPL